MSAEVEETDRSTSPTVVEYAVQSMFKGQSLQQAAKTTAKKLSGGTNMFLGPGVTLINPKSLEEALWTRLVTLAVTAIPKFKAGKEHYAIDGILSQFNQKPKLRAEFKKRIVAAIGRDPFTSDDIGLISISSTTPMLKKVHEV